MSRSSVILDVRYSFINSRLMNMLVGVLVEVVSVVSALEKEEMTINFLKAKLSEMLHVTNADKDWNGSINKPEFDALLLRVEAVKMLQEVGVDVVGLVDLSEFIFKSVQELCFGDFCELILQFRGSNHSTVKDIVDMRKFVVQELDQLYEDLTAREFFMAELMGHLFDQVHQRLPQQPVAPPGLLQQPEPPNIPAEKEKDDASLSLFRPSYVFNGEKNKRKGPSGIGRPKRTTKRLLPGPLIDDLAWTHHVPQTPPDNVSDDEEV